MKLGIGIDAGGTYTDAVVISFDEGRVHGASKAPTTKDDLSVGIGNALAGLEDGLLKAASSVLLSTTLATNACVEDKGGFARLVFIGGEANVVEKIGAEYGLPPCEEIFFLPSAKAGGPFAEKPWGELARERESWFLQAEGVAVVDMDARENGGRFERMLCALIEGEFERPVICGSELSAELNCLRRAANTLLNVRLIPVIGEFLQAVRATLAARGITAPVSITRSDGSLMSESFTRVRPVETLLCGPAAGLTGASFLTGEENCLVVDMGGTTTDVSFVLGRAAKKAAGGINIGKWKTFAKGVFTETFALGGDTRLAPDRYGKYGLTARRAMPMCMAEARFPGIAHELSALLEHCPEGHTRPLHEFFIGIRSAGSGGRFSPGEKALAAAALERPVPYREAAEICGADLYNFDAGRLESEGIILRAGLTPTDVMHLRGDYVKHPTGAACLALRFCARSMGAGEEELSDRVYGLVEERLYENIARVLLKEQYPELKDGDFRGPLGKMLRMSRLSKENKIAAPRLETPLCLVGIGAPVHIFLPRVAELLGARCVIPENANVANALGAAVSRVETEFSVDIKVRGLDEYTVFGPFETLETGDEQQAYSFALAQAERAAREEARRRGLTGELCAETELVHQKCETRYGAELHLGSKATARVRSGEDSRAAGV